LPGEDGLGGFRRNESLENSSPVKVKGKGTGTGKKRQDEKVSNVGARAHVYIKQKTVANAGGVLRKT